MGFWALLEVASMPILQVLIISGLGAFMATDYCNLLPADARRLLNKIVFVVFTPSLMFASLTQTVTLQDIISWWFMPVNVGLTVLFGTILGWIAVKLLRPDPELEGLVIAACSSANLGNLVLIIVPAICREEGSPFGDRDICHATGLSYASFSMALGGFYLWTYTYQLIRSTAMKYKALEAAENAIRQPNNNYEADAKTTLLQGSSHEYVSVIVPSSKRTEDFTGNHPVSAVIIRRDNQFRWTKLSEILRQILEQLLAPPTVGAILGLMFGTVSWLKGLIIGDGAPFRVIQDCIQLLGDGTIPSITLIMGGNLTKGLSSRKMKPLVLISIICVKYILLPLIGIGVVGSACRLGFLPRDPLYHFVLMLQFTLPPAMNLGTITQLFDVGQDECSVLFLWTYLMAALALTVWSTVYMWLLS